MKNFLNSQSTKSRPQRLGAALAITLAFTANPLLAITAEEQKKVDEILGTIKPDADNTGEYGNKWDVENARFIPAGAPPEKKSEASYTLERWCGDNLIETMTITAAPESLANIIEVLNAYAPEGHTWRESNQ